MQPQIWHYPFFLRLAPLQTLAAHLACYEFAVGFKFYDVGLFCCLILNLRDLAFQAPYARLPIACPPPPPFLLSPLSNPHTPRDYKPLRSG